MEFYRGYGIKYINSIGRKGSIIVSIYDDEIHKGTEYALDDEDEARDVAKSLIDNLH